MSHDLTMAEYQAMREIGMADVRIRDADADRWIRWRDRGLASIHELGYAPGLRAHLTVEGWQAMRAFEDALGRCWRRRLLHWLTLKLAAPRSFYDRLGVHRYLSRWYLTGELPKEDPALAGQNAPEQKPRRFALFLHRFHRSDMDGELHSHPWAWALCLVLVGGYTEERRNARDEIVRRTIRPWRFNVLSADTYHRVDLLEHDSWSLVLTGPRIPSGDWWFWNRLTRQRALWSKFIAWQRGKLEHPDWEDDRRA